MTSVAVVSCVYGPFARFVPRWAEAVGLLDPAPDQVVVASDRRHPFGFDQVVKSCPWAYPQAFYLNAAVAAADTDWVWVCDIDDFPMRDGLAGLDEVDADVWQMGFERSDGETYVPQVLSTGDYLELQTNPYVGGSAIRTEAFRAAGGYPDVALQDWALWRRLAQAGATFVSSGRTHFHYMRHSQARGEVELVAGRRDGDILEMVGSEYAGVS